MQTMRELTANVARALLKQFVIVVVISIVGWPFSAAAKVAVDDYQKAIIPLLVDYRGRLIHHERGITAAKFVDGITANPDAHFSQTAKEYIAALFMEGAVINVYGHTTALSSASFYNPFFNVAFIIKLSGDPSREVPPDVSDVYVASGDAVMGMMDQGFQTREPSGNNIFQRTKKMADALSFLLLDPNRYNDVRSDIQSNGSVSQMSRSSDLVLYGLTHMSSTEKAGLDAFTSGAENGTLSSKADLPKLRLYKSFDLDAWPKELRTKLHCVFSAGDEKSRFTYLASENRPGVVIKLKTTVSDDRLSVLSVELVNVMYGLTQISE
jgi:hypothetical protein